MRRVEYFRIADSAKKALTPERIRLIIKLYHADAGYQEILDAVNAIDEWAPPVSRTNFYKYIKESELSKSDDYPAQWFIRPGSLPKVAKDEGFVPEYLPLGDILAYGYKNQIGEPVTVEKVNKMRAQWGLPPFVADKADVPIYPRYVGSSLGYLADLFVVGVLTSP